MKTLEYYKTRKRRAKTNAWRLMEDSPESNYWLGYLLADGCFYLDGKIGFGQSGKNKQAVLEFAKFIGFGGKIQVSEGGHRLIVEFGDKEICSDYCLKFGIPRGLEKDETTKTYIPPDFHHIKSRLGCYYSFLAGLVAGDGSVDEGHCTIGMHKNYLPFLQNINPEAKLVERKIKDESWSTDPWKASCYIGTDQLQQIYQTALANKIPLVKQKWQSVLSRVVRIEAETLFFDNRKIEMQGLVAAGWPRVKIAKKLGISQASVSMILSGKQR